MLDGMFVGSRCKLLQTARRGFRGLEVVWCNGTAISGWMAPEAPAACSGRLFGDTLRGKSNEFFEAIVRMKL